MTISRDYHGFRLDDALHDLELVVGDVRQAGKTEHTEFITGFGVIRGAVFSMLKVYGLEPAFKIGNEGTIIVTIE